MHDTQRQSAPRRVEDRRRRTSDAACKPCRNVAAHCCSIETVRLHLLLACRAVCLDES